jgi:acetoin utilization deacetylase AcuC-like enzyme
LLDLITIMNFLYNSVCAQHQTGEHPENIKRILAFDELPSVDFPDGEPYLEWVHPAHYVDFIRRSAEESLPIDEDTYTSQGSFLAATRAVGAAVLAAEQGDFALIRPPGHHAYAEKAGGFCLFNSVAVAAQKLAQEGKKVLIFDFDGHQGDGTADIFYHSDQVMYWSMHQHPAFPGKGMSNEIGAGPGEGFTINIPLPPGCADDIFLDAIRHVLPIALQFKPDVLAVSAGFDAHQYDPLLDLRVSTTGYYQIGKLLHEHFPHMFAVLEGGYNIEWLRKSAFSFLAGVNGEADPQFEAETMSGLRVWETYEIYLHSSLGYLRKHWKTK